MSLTVALVGNPNCGKSTVFNALTGSTQRIGNWPGVTVERKAGSFRYQHHQVNVIDLPGTYSLTAITEQQCLDEKIACEFLLSDDFDLVVNIIDATNLERNLYLTSQLLEMGVPVVIALNMMDVAQRRQIHINTKELSDRLGCPVIVLAEKKKKGLPDLKKSIVNSHSPIVVNPVRYPAELEHAVDDIAKTLSGTDHWRTWCARQLLEGDYLAYQHVTKEQTQLVKQWLESIQEDLGEDADVLIAGSRYAWAHELAENVVIRKKSATTYVSSKVDNFVLHRWLGIPLFLLVMYAMFYFAINMGGALQDYFDKASEAVFVTGTATILHVLHAPNWLIAILSDGAGRGINTTVTFIPVIGAMFLFLSFLESSGYMSRGAFVVDRLMRVIGLPGKSFVPMIVGFGCNVPAIMAARTLDTKRDRVLTIMMSPFMSCGARLAIYAVFTAAFFPKNGHNVVFCLYLIGVVMAVMTGLILRKTLLRGESSELVMEMPSYHLPRWSVIWSQTWYRLKSFIVKAGRLIVPVCMLIGSLNAIQVTYHHHPTSALGVLGRLASPLVAPMGVQEDNWPATVGLVTGVLAKEVVVGTLNTLYSQERATQKDKSVFGVMSQRFGGGIAAFSYLLFVLLYFPCVSATAAMVRELNKGWAFFSVFWTTSIAYGVAVLFYQCATIEQHVLTSFAWISMVVSLFVVTVMMLKKSALKEAKEVAACT